MAVEFDGVNDHIVCGSAASVDNLGLRSASARIRADGMGEGNYGLVLSKDDGSSGFTFGFNGGVPASNELFFLYRWSSSGGQWTTNAGISLGAWVHVAVTYANGSTANDPIIYVNGVAVAITEDINPVGGATDDSAAVLTVGNRAATDRTFDGQIDDPRYFNRILTPEEVAVLAAGYRGPLGGEVMWLSGNDFATLAHPDGTTLTTSHVMSDLSGNGNDGVPTNSPIARASEAPRLGPWWGYIYDFADVVYTNVTPAAAAAIAAAVLGRFEKEIHGLVASAVAATTGAVLRLRTAWVRYRQRHHIAPEKPLTAEAPNRRRGGTSERD